MRRLLAILLFAACSVMGSTPSYWFSGWQTKPDAEQAQAYFMLPGTGITFTTTNNRILISSTGGGGGTNTSFATNATYALYAGFATNSAFSSYSFYATNAGDATFAWLASFATNANFATNALYAVWSTNWTGSNALYQAMTNYVLTNSPRQYATNLLGFAPGTNVTFSTNAGTLSVNANPASGFQTPWLQTEDAAGYDLLNVHTLRPFSINQETNSRFQFDASGQMFLNFSTSGGGHVNAQNVHGFPQIDFGADTTFSIYYQASVPSATLHFFPGSTSDLTFLSGEIDLTGPAFVLQPGTKAYGNGAGISNAMGAAFYKGVVSLSGFPITVPCPIAHATSAYMLTYISVDGTVAPVSVKNVVDGVSFDIVSSKGGDVNNVSWAIFNP